jgi:hypothetical protein
MPIVRDTATLATVGMVRQRSRAAGNDGGTA